MSFWRFSRKIFALTVYVPTEEKAGAKCPMLLTTGWNITWAHKPVYRQQRLPSISVTHLYNLRQPKEVNTCLRQRRTLEKTSER